MILVILLILAQNIFAYNPQEGNVTANVGPYIFKTHFKDTKSNVSSPYTTGIGLIVNGDSSTKGALEIGMFHLNKRFLRSKGQKFIAETSQIIHITMGYKWWLNRYFSTSTAIYSAYPLGNTRIIYSDFAKGEEIPTSSRDTTEYGLDFAFQYQAWKGIEFDIVTEFRYSLSLTSRDHEEADHYGMFVGLRYLIQEKYLPKKPNKKKYD